MNFQPYILKVAYLLAGAVIAGPAGAVAGGVIGRVVGGPNIVHRHRHCWINDSGYRHCG
jgi:osmotically inducible lipoprotein OsmB